MKLLKAHFNNNVTRGILGAMLLLVVLTSVALADTIYIPFLAKSGGNFYKE